MNFKEKRNFNKIVYSKFTIILLTFILFVLLRAVWSVYQKANIAHLNKVKAQNQLSKLVKREDSLLAGIEKLKSSRGVESEIRNRFGVVKEGEEVVVIVDRRGEQNDDMGDADKNENLFQKFLKFFE